eukprot:4370165-Amphidinium_carterae.1
MLIAGSTQICKMKAREPPKEREKSASPTNQFICGKHPEIHQVNCYPLCAFVSSCFFVWHTMPNGLKFFKNLKSSSSVERDESHRGEATVLCQGTSRKGLHCNQQQMWFTSNKFDLTGVCMDQLALQEADKTGLPAQENPGTKICSIRSPSMGALLLGA